MHENTSAVISAFSLGIYIFITASVRSIYQSSVHCVLHISISVDDYLFIQCANVLSCCHGDDCPCYIVARMTCPPSLAVFVNLYTSFVSFVSHCATMSKV